MIIIKYAKAKQHYYEFEPTVCAYCGKKEPCKCK